ncbi:hypothetical protein ACFP3U_32305 [Kitasatospora misakiensis]|uniref:Uncharacterized protein n=1 Tax=Kitasatospora misakiensis TaxID=67330 RepID=A0ABW0XCW6_9ACTN
MSNDGHKFVANSITVNYHNHSSDRGEGAIGPSEPAASAADGPAEGGQNSAAPAGDPAPAGDGSGRKFYQDLFVFLLVIVAGLTVTVLLSQSLVATLLLLIAGLASAWVKIHMKE